LTPIRRVVTGNDAQGRWAKLVKETGAKVE